MNAVCKCSGMNGHHDFKCPQHSAAWTDEMVADANRAGAEDAAECARIKNSREFKDGERIDLLEESNRQLHKCLEDRDKRIAELEASLAAQDFVLAGYVNAGELAKLNDPRLAGRGMMVSKNSAGGRIALYREA